MTGSKLCPPVFCCNFGIATEEGEPGSTPALVIIRASQVMMWSIKVRLAIATLSIVSRATKLTVGLSGLFTGCKRSRRLGQCLGEDSTDDDTGRVPHSLSLGVVILLGLFLFCQQPCLLTLTQAFARAMVQYKLQKNVHQGYRCKTRASPCWPSASLPRIA